MPPKAVDALRVTDLSVDGRRMRFAETECPDANAVSSTGEGELTATEETLKLAEVLPDATVTLAGTVAFAELLDSATTNPPEGATFESVTVPVEEVPPTTVVGKTDSELTDWANPVQHINAEIKTNNDLRNLGWAISSSIRDSKLGGILPSSSYRIYIDPNYRATA